MTVLCIKDNWDNKPLLGTWPVKDEMYEVIEVYEDPDGVFYILEGFQRHFLWYSKHFIPLVEDGVIEYELKEIFNRELV